MTSTEATSSGNKLPPGELIESLYDYTEDVLDGKVLNFLKGDSFIVIKSTKPEEWIYAVNREGKLGYVPANFVRIIPTPDPEDYLCLLDEILDKLSRASATDMIAVRQINHARVKLTQIRCEIFQRIQSNQQRTSASTLDDAVSEIIPEEEVTSNQETVICSPRIEEVIENSSINNKAIESLSNLQDDNGHDFHGDEKTKETADQTVSKKEIVIEKDKMNGVSSREGHPEAVLTHMSCDEREDTGFQGKQQKETEQRNRPKECPTSSGTNLLQNSEKEQEHQTRDTKNPKSHEKKNPSHESASPSSSSIKRLPDEKMTENEGIHCQKHHHHLDDQSHQQKKEEKSLESDVSEIMVSQLIERVRVCSQLNHQMCKKTIQEVLSFLSDSFPSWKNTLKAMSRILHEDGFEGKNMTPSLLYHQSVDSENLKDIFSRLWSCKNDEQQRSWPVHQDEELILSTLQDLTTILTDANPVLTREVLKQNNYDHIHMLTAYFQMESRRSLRMELFRVFTQVIRLLNHLIPEYFLTSVLPSCLADEMINYVSDTERWKQSSTLFTLIFSTGDPPPITLYDHLNEKFISILLNIIEGFMGEDLSCMNNIPAELSISPLLAFNLHLTSRDRNLVVKTLTNRTKASQLTENLVSYLNWEEDPTVFSDIFSDQSNSRRVNAVHKLLVDIFESTETARLFYVNDIKVLMDIIITHLNNLSANSRERLACLTLAEKIILNTSYREEPHKQDQLLKCLKGIISNEDCPPEEKNLAAEVQEVLSREYESKC